MHGNLTALARGRGVFFEGEAMILVQDGLAEFAAMRLGNLDFPGRHR
jgi:hypothetical protein